jgi:hypothetical protein
MHPCRFLLVAPGSAKQGVVTLFARWAYAPQRIFIRPHDISWARHSQSPVRERSPDIPLDGVMQDAAYGLRRIHLPRTPVNREAGRSNARSDASVVVKHAFGDPQRQLLFPFLEVPLSVLVCVVADPEHHRILVWEPCHYAEGPSVPTVVPDDPSLVGGRDHPTVT